MKNIIILTVFAFAIFLLTRYYQQSSLNFKDGVILLEVKGKKVKLKSTSVNIHNEHFSNVNIVQKELMIEGQKSYYEEATTEGLYEFNHNIKKIIDVLFDCKKVQNIFSIHSLHAMQVITKNGEVINLFVTDNDTKEFHLLYGLSNKVFRSTILALTGTDKFGFELDDAVELNEAKIQWTVLNNDINGIISSIDY